MFIVQFASGKGCLGSLSGNGNYFTNIKRRLHKWTAKDAVTHYRFLQHLINKHFIKVFFPYYATLDVRLSKVVMISADFFFVLVFTFSWRFNSGSILRASQLPTPYS